MNFQRIDADQMTKQLVFSYQGQWMTVKNVRFIGQMVMLDCIIRQGPFKGVPVCVVRGRKEKVNVVGEEEVEE